MSQAMTELIIIQKAYDANSKSITTSDQFIQKAIDMYNGYIFGDNTTILNPWSLLNYADSRELKPYWINTSSNDFIFDLMRKSPTFRDELEKIIKGEEVDIEINENLTFNNNSLYN